MTKAGVLHQAFVVVAGGLLLAGCGAVAASGAHGARTAPGARTAHHGARTPSAHGTRAAAVGWRHLDLPSAMDIRAVHAGSGSSVTLVLATAPDAANPQGVWASVAYNWRTGALGSLTTASPARPATASYQLVSQAGGPPMITGGPGAAPLAWPRSIPTYTSGENPAGNQFGVDNAIIGQTGQWLWAALKGPKNPPATTIPLVWGYRHWDRLVALNMATGQHEVYSIPRDLSSALYGPLWVNAPVFGALPSGEGLVALGHWVAVVPANPSGVASLPTLAGPPPAAAAAAARTAVALITHTAWTSIDADAAFWNCYVMADPSPAACPHGASAVDENALSMQTTFYNHGDVGFSLLWAMTVPVSSASEQQARTAAEKLLEQGLAGSYLGASIGSPSAAALRALYHGQPPHPLPGYTRRQGYYWASTAGG